MNSYPYKVDFAGPSAADRCLCSVGPSDTEGGWAGRMVLAGRASLETREIDTISKNGPKSAVLFRFE